jgi:hypothetical protein
MNKKFIYFCILSGIYYKVFANNFQNFQNQYNLGIQFSQIGLIDGNYNHKLAEQKSLNIEIEHLFDNNIWLGANLNTVISYSQPNLGPGYLNGGGVANSNNTAYAFGQNPFMNSFILKGGYTFDFYHDNMQVLIYAMLGRNANFAASTIVANDYNTIGEDYFYTGGFGARFSYIMAKDFMLYLDQLYNYNWDNSGAIKSVQTSPENYGKSYAATNYQFTTTIGVRYNINDTLQFGISGYYNNYQHQSNIAGVVYIPQHTFGENISIGFTY